MKILTTDDEVQQYDKTLQVLEEYSFCVFLCVHMTCLCLSMIDLAVMLILDCFWGTFQDSNISEKEFYAEFYKQLEPPLEKINHPWEYSLF